MKLDAGDHSGSAGQDHALSSELPRALSLATRGSSASWSPQVARPPKLFGGSPGVHPNAEPHAVIRPRRGSDHRASCHELVRECTRSPSFMIAPTPAVGAIIELHACTHSRSGCDHRASCLDPLRERFGAASFMSGATLGALRGDLDIGIAVGLSETASGRTLRQDLGVDLDVETQRAQPGSRPGSSASGGGTMSQL